MACRSRFHSLDDLVAESTTSNVRPSEIGLDQEVEGFETAADKVLLGDLELRTNFARNVMLLFATANTFVLVGLGVVFWQDCVQLAAHEIVSNERIIDGRVIMALLGATTIQLGTVIYTITRAIFPSQSGASR